MPDRKNILRSFTDTMLTSPTEPIQYLLLPYLSSWPGLPFAAIVEGLCGITELDSPFLLYGLLKLTTRDQVGKLDEGLITTYLDVVAQLVPCVLRLPRKSAPHSFTFAQPNDDDGGPADERDADEDDDSVVDDDSGDEKMDMDSNVTTASAAEKCILREIVAMLNEAEFVDQVMLMVDRNVENGQFLNSLCRICHVLMVYNRSAMYEYRLVFLLCAKTQLVRILWKTMTMDQKFTCPLSLIAKGILVGE